jgi:hypothetical protein
LLIQLTFRLTFANILEFVFFAGLKPRETMDEMRVRQRLAQC